MMFIEDMRAALSCLKEIRNHEQRGSLEPINKSLLVCNAILLLMNADKDLDNYHIISKCKCCCDED